MKLNTKQIKSLKKWDQILVIGAGPTGVETATHLAHNFPKKKIGIISRG